MSAAADWERRYVAAETENEELRKKLDRTIEALEDIEVAFNEIDMVAIAANTLEEVRRG